MDTFNLFMNNLITAVSIEPGKSEFKNGLGNGIISEELHELST